MEEKDMMMAAIIAGGLAAHGGSPRQVAGRARAIAKEIREQVLFGAEAPAPKQKKASEKKA